MEKQRTANKVLPKAGLTGFFDTFGLKRTLVFQINSSAESSRLRQYPNRSRGAKIPPLSKPPTVYYIEHSLFNSEHFSVRLYVLKC